MSRVIRVVYEEACQKIEAGESRFFLATGAVAVTPLEDRFLFVLFL
jgi:hypothetical protein